LHSRCCSRRPQTWGTAGDDDHGYGGTCGYGQVDDKDENNYEGESWRGSDKAKAALPSLGASALRHSDKSNNDRDEDEDDDGWEGGGGGDQGARTDNDGSVVHVAVLGSRGGVTADRL
jgi:hypothetical protein